MSLRNILVEIGSVLGLSLDNSSEQAYHINELNKVAKEFYDSDDLPGCLHEQVFQIDDSDDQFTVSFPYYVGVLRGVRHYNSIGKQISIESMRPRYAKGLWTTDGGIKFRIKANSPLSREIDNAGIISFTLSKVEAVAVNIHVAGATDYADNFHETVVIPAATLTAFTVEQYNSIEHIEKEAYNNYNIAIKQIDDVELGVIPNRLLSPIYTHVKIRKDDYSIQNNNSYPLNTVEVLYKQAFTPFVNLWDEFPCPNCDNILFWLFVRNYAAYRPELEAKSALANIQISRLKSQLTQNDELGKSLEVNLMPSAMGQAYNAKDLDNGYYHSSDSWVG